MKKQKRFFMWIAGTFLMLLSFNSRAQVTYNAVLSGRTQPTCNTFEFDVYLKSTGATFQLAQFRWALC